MAIKSYSNKALLVTLVLWIATMLAAPWILATPDAAAGALTAVFKPGSADREMMVAIAQAGGRVVRAGRFHNVLVVYDDAPGFSGRLKAAGAWTVLDTRLASGCFLIPEVTP